MKYSVDIIQVVCGTDPGKYLKESIESMISQFDDVDNYIVVRDGSLTHEQIDVLEQFKYYLTIIDNQGKRGLAGGLNTAIRYSTADILVRMDSDDISSPDRIRILLKEFENDPDLLLLGSGAYEIDNRGKIFHIKKMPKTPKDIVRMSMTRSPFIHQSVAFKRNLFFKIGLYDEDYYKAQDYELWARIIIKHSELLNRIKNIENILIIVRLSDTFWDRRSFKNIRYGTPISLKLIFHYKSYWNVIPLFFKVLLRISPGPVKRIAYKKFRANNRYELNNETLPFQP